MIDSAGFCQKNLKKGDPRKISTAAFHENMKARIEEE